MHWAEANKIVRPPTFPYVPSIPGAISLLLRLSVMPLSKFQDFFLSDLECRRAFHLGLFLLGPPQERLVEVDSRVQVQPGIVHA